jgi:hypothetical protein
MTGGRQSDHALSVREGALDLVAAVDFRFSALCKPVRFRADCAFEAEFG